MSRRPLQLIRDFAALSGGELVAKLAGFAAFAYLSRVLGPSAYGGVELAVALVTFASLIVDFGFGPVAAAEITHEKSRAPKLAARVPAARLRLAIPAFIFVIGSSMLLDLTTENRYLIWVFGLSLFLHAWTQNWLFQGLDLMPLVAPAQPLRMLAFLIGVVLFVSGPERLWKVGAVEVGAIASMVVYYLMAQKRIGFGLGLDFDFVFFRSLCRKALPISISQLLWAFSQYVPTVLVAALVAGSEVAWFGSSLRLVISLNTFVFLYFFNLYPSLVKSAEQPPDRFTSLITPSFRITAWVGTLCGLLGTIAAEPLCRLAYGPEFGQAGPTFAVLVWVLPISLLSGHARFSLLAYSHQVWELASAAIGAVVTVALGLLLIPKYGSVGASIAMVVAAWVVWVAAHHFSKLRIGPMPFLGPLVKPAIAAVLATLAAYRLPIVGGWAAPFIAAVVYLGFAIVLDRGLVHDLTRLWRTRSTPTGASNDSE
jgi:O-antigen/teichoic acid export membrane protein